MQMSNGYIALVVLLAKTDALITFRPVAVRNRMSGTGTPSLQFPSPTTTSELKMTEETDVDEIERLKTMAAKLRAEAASLEADQKQEMANAAQRAFDKFDTNRDGKISLEELKAGLEKEFKTELPEKRVTQLMEDFDKSGDGALQLDEFVTVEQFRNKLDSLARDEKASALAAAKEAQAEEEMSKFLQAQLDMVNDKPPSNQDKILAVLPYLFPLLDGLNFARFLVLENSENVFAALVALTYALYRSVPFGGFIAFIALSSLSGNTRINRLIRFNMQQAIYIDIALFFPGLIGALVSLVGGNLIPPKFAELGSDFMFATLLLTVGYCMISSLLGITPDKLPFISEAVNARVPTVDMFDIDGSNFVPKRPKKEDEEGKD